LDHVEHVKATVPKDQLLIMNITEGDGWAPLCKFLGRPIPDVPFPKLNDSLVLGPVAEEGFLSSYREFFAEEEQAGLLEKYRRVFTD
jgi:hypothetical protein